MLHFLLAAATKPAVHSPTTSPCALKNNVKKEDGGKAVDSGLPSDPPVPDYAAVQVILLCQTTPPVSSFFDLSALCQTFSHLICFVLFCLANRMRTKKYLMGDHRRCLCHLTTVSNMLSNVFVFEAAASVLQRIKIHHLSSLSFGEMVLRKHTHTHVKKIK